MCGCNKGRIGRGGSGSRVAAPRPTNTSSVLTSIRKIVSSTARKTV